MGSVKVCKRSVGVYGAGVVFGSVGGGIVCHCNGLLSVLAEQMVAQGADKQPTCEVPRGRAYY